MLSVLAVLLLGVLGVASAQVFPARMHPVGAGPFSFGVADINGDGFQDAVTLNSWSQTFSLLLGTSAGDLTSFKTHPADGLPWSFALADFDSDGWMDAVLALATNTTEPVAVARGLPGGGFGPPTILWNNPVAGNIGAGDVNADGRPDIVSIGSLGGTPDSVAVLINKGAMQFELLPLAGIDSGLGRFVVGDFDVDGDADLVVLRDADYEEYVLVLLGDGHGGFAVGKTWEVYEGLAAAGLLVTDLDEDGWPDIAVAVYLDYGGKGLAADGLMPSFLVMRGLGGGSFADPVFIVSTASPLQLAAGDVDLDGSVDLAGTIFLDGATLLRGTLADTTWSATDLPVGTASKSVAVADIQGDGQPEILVTSVGKDFDTSQPGNLVVLSGLRPGAGPSGLSTFPSPYLGPPLHLADFDADGALDLEAASSAGVSVQPGDGAGGFGDAIMLDAGANIWDHEVGDVDGDGSADLVALSTDLLVNSNLGGLAFGVASASSLPTPLNRIALDDLDQDGDLDVAGVGNLGQYQYKAAFLLNSGNGRYSSAAVADLPAEPLGVSLGDGDGDGLIDAWIPHTTAWYETTGQLTWLKGDGSGGIAQSATLDVARGPQDVLVTDLGADGIPDVMVSHANPGDPSEVRVLQPDGGAFGVAAIFPVGEGCAVLALRDINQDGGDDLVTTNVEPGGYQPSNSFSVLPGLAAGGFGVPQSFAVHAWTKSLAVGDVTGDGRPDVVGNGPFSASNFGFLHRNLGAAPPFASIGPGLAGSDGVPQLSGSGSLAPDTKVSLVVQHARAGAPVWLIVGQGLSSQPMLGGILTPTPEILLGPLVANAGGDIVLSGRWPSGVPSGERSFVQAWVLDVAGPHGFAATGGLLITAP